MNDAGTICQVIQQCSDWVDAGARQLPHLVAVCPEEGFFDLFESVPHWAFETMLEVLSAILGITLWPFIRKGWKAALKHWLHQHDPCCANQETKS